MATLYLIRHGQARLGSDDYDRLSELGRRQCAQLGLWMKERGLRFEAVMRGSLRRHRESVESIASQLQGLPEALERPALNEYDSEAVLRTVISGSLPAPATPEGYKHHFRLLRQGLLQWINGHTQPEGMPSWADFVDGVGKALDEVRLHHPGDVLLISSGGPIAAALSQVLGAPPHATVELNMRLRNSAVCELSFTPKRHSLLSYNTLPHLDHPERRDWATYA